MSAEGSQRWLALTEKVAGVALEVTWTLVAIITGFACLQILFALGALPGPNEQSPAQLVGGPLLMGIAAAAYAMAQRHSRPELRAPLLRQRPPLFAVSWQVPALVAALVLGSASLSALLAALGVPVQEQAQVRAITDGGWRIDAQLSVLAFSALVLAPVAEECLFRGLLFRRVYLAAGPAFAYAVSAVLFAVSHLNFSGTVIYLWQALVFAAAYRVTGRLWAAVLVHFVNNALTLTLLLSGLA